MHMWSNTASLRFLRDFQFCKELLQFGKRMVNVVNKYDEIH